MKRAFALVALSAFGWFAVHAAADPPSPRSSEASAPDAERAILRRVHVELAPLGFSEMVGACEDVLHGVVTGVEHVTPRNRPGYRLIQVVPRSFTSGRAASMWELRVLGAQSARDITLVDAAPEFRVGEEIAVFLCGVQGERSGVLGLERGVLRVAADAGEGARVRGLHAQTDETVGAFLARVATERAAQSLAW